MFVYMKRCICIQTQTHTLSLSPSHCLSHIHTHTSTYETSEREFQNPPTHKHTWHTTTHHRTTHPHTHAQTQAHTYIHTHLDISDRLRSIGRRCACSRTVSTCMLAWDSFAVNVGLLCGNIGLFDGDILGSTFPDSWKSLEFIGTLLSASSEGT